MPLILLIEDEDAIVRAVEKTLSLEPAFRLETVRDPEAAVEAVLRVRPDLVLLDIRMPGGDGRMILRSLKSNAAARGIPVIFLTGLGSEGDRVLGLDLGADDYVVKPFGAMELLARIRAVLRRVSPDAAGGAVEAAGLRLEPGERRAILDGKPLRLQPKEFEILYLLASQPGHVVPRARLIEQSSSYGMPLATRSVDTHIKNLRRKLGRRAGLIETVPKLGYRFAA